MRQRLPGGSAAIRCRFGLRRPALHARSASLWYRSECRRPAAWPSPMPQSRRFHQAASSARSSSSFRRSMAAHGPHVGAARWGIVRCHDNNKATAKTTDLAFDFLIYRLRPHAVCSTAYRVPRRASACCNIDVDAGRGDARRHPCKGSPNSAMSCAVVDRVLRQ